MKQFDDNELRNLLASYEVPMPSAALVERTKERMHDEMLHLAAEPAMIDKWVFLLVGMAIAMSLCLFYMVTVGTFVRFMLPQQMFEIYKYSMYAFTFAGGSLVTGSLMMLYLKQSHVQHAYQN